MTAPGWFTFVAVAFAFSVAVVVAGVLEDDLGLVAFGVAGAILSIVEWFTAIDEANR